MVLSGGGANGLAHIGVLKALEENNIPIDYITGTSAGALVGGMYAAGLSPEQMEAYVLSEDFLLMTSGEIRPSQRFLFREAEPNASLVSLSFAQDSILKKSLPTNFTSSSLLDYEMMKTFGLVSASHGNNFDSLYVPFRCVASDIAKKQSVVFEDGNLNAAIRASMTFPFYLRSIKVDNVLLFDGGLYNNFPADVMYEDFDADYIIGSNVSYNADLPDDEDLISQLTNMLVAYSDFSLPCEEGIIIQPQSGVGTFSFKDAKEAIDAGYNATLAQMDSLKEQISRRSDPKDLYESRIAFHKEIIPLKVSSITIQSDKKNLRNASRSIMRKKKAEVLNEKQIERRYFRLSAAPQIDFIYPTVELNSDSTYNLDLAINKARELQLEVGGHFSSRPVNTGYVGLSYQTIGKIMTKTHLESYFGKFYGSGKAKFTLEIPSVYPVSTDFYFVLNRWDYFRSFATFFEDVQPSFLIENEIYSGLSINHPLGNTLKSTFDARFYEIENEYYQTEDFTNKDTADMTRLNGFSGSWAITQNNLNRKQFASGGHYFRFKARYNYGTEHSQPGSTGNDPYDVWNYHSWINLSLDYQSFIVDHRNSWVQV